VVRISGLALVGSLLPGCGGPSAPAPLTEELAPVTLVAPGTFEGDPLDCASAILVEASTGTVLFEQNPDEPRAPASLVKMMLELLVMEMVDRGEIALTDTVRASRWASQMGGSQVFLKEGEAVPLEALMRSIAIASANDACVAVAEHVAGSVEIMVDMMNRRAGDLGLQVTRFINVHGLDEEHGLSNVTTARDEAIIGRALVSHPQVLEWSSIRRAPFRDGTFMLENTNLLVDRFRGLDGIKTGYTERAGYNLCATAERGGLRFVSVVLGAESRPACAEITSGLLTRAFHEVRVVTATAVGDRVGGGPVVVAQSQATEIEPVATQDVKVVVPAIHIDRVTVERQITDPLLAPLLEGSPVGEAVVSYDGEPILRVPLVSDRDVEAKGIRAWFRGIAG
jgi:D-alanyl-D-alanine carboxypeptidase (penicillin-binding protein 5/6)